jgi:hypothetical protein
MLVELRWATSSISPLNVTQEIANQSKLTGGQKCLAANGPQHVSTAFALRSAFEYFGGNKRLLASLVFGQAGANLV